MCRFPDPRNLVYTCRALEEKVDEEKTKRMAADKRAEKLKERTDQLTLEVQALQDQVNTYKRALRYHFLAMHDALWCRISVCLAYYYCRCPTPFT